MADEFNLPGSSFEELQKIIKGYSSSSDNVSLESLAKLIGLGKTTISRSNKFLSEIGLISGGIRKSSTELGKNLGRALEHQQEGDSKRYWFQAVQTNESIAGLATTVRIQNGMTQDEFSEHVLYVSGQNNNSRNRTGARCIVDIFIAAGLLEEHEGKLNIATPQESIKMDKEISDIETDKYDQPKEDVRPLQSENTTSINRMNIPQVAINIQLHLPETDNADVYEKLFRALREQLINPKE